MSWMDSWSRPSTNSKVPAPLYLSDKDVPYCHTCGRVMSSKKSAKKQANSIKYCSDRCRARKPGPADRQIEHKIASLLNGEPDSGIEQTAARSRVVKGDPRLILTCEEIEEAVFGSRFDPDKTHGRRRNRKSRAIPDKYSEWRSVDMVTDSESEGEGQQRRAAVEHGNGHGNDDEMVVQYDTDGSGFSIEGGVRIRPPQDQSDVNFSVGGERGRQEKIEESAEDLERRRQGQKRAEEREMVRRAARRAVIFGLEVPRQESTVKKPVKGKGKSKRMEEEVEPEAESATEIRKAEAIMASMVVEPSFAKGNWSIRWRE